MIFRACRDDMLADEPRPLDPQRLARMAEAGNFLAAPCPSRRRRRRGQAIARGLAWLAGIAAVAWIVSEIAVAALLDEARLAALGIGP